MNMRDSQDTMYTHPLATWLLCFHAASPLLASPYLPALGHAGIHGWCRALINNVELSFILRKAFRSDIGKQREWDASSLWLKVNCITELDLYGEIERFKMAQQFNYLAQNNRFYTNPCSLSASSTSCKKVFLPSGERMSQCSTLIVCKGMPYFFWQTCGKVE